MPPPPLLVVPLALRRGECQCYKASPGAADSSTPAPALCRSPAMATLDLTHLDQPLRLAAAARSIEGQPDLILSRQGGTLDLALFERIAAMPEVLVAAPQVEAAVQMRGADGKVHGLRLLGIDALAATTLSPDLLARPPADESPLQLWLDPQRLHLNRAAAQLLDEQQALIELRHTQGLQLQTTRLQRGGQVEAGGGPLAVIDIAGAQVLLGRMTLDQIALRLQA
eukprot:gene9818-12459_t